MFNKSYEYKNTNSFAIIGSFTRSLDTSHKENNRIHLISSICLIKQKEMDLIGKYLFDYNSVQTQKISYVFILTPNLKEYLIPEVTNKDSLIIIKCSISTFLKNLLFDYKSNLFFNSVFGELNLESKDFDVICQQSVFIFLNQMWSNVVLNFKLNKVDLSGGSISKRHLLHTVDFQLVLNLIKIFGDIKNINNLIYNSFTNSILSSSIPLDLYNQILASSSDILTMKVKDVNNISFLNKNKNPLIYSEDIIRYYNSYEDIVKSNFALTIEMLIADITNGIKSDLEKLNNSNNKYSLNLNSLSYDKSKIENIDNESTKYMRNKEKKRFKKERAEIKSQGVSRQLSKINYEISILNVTKENIETKLINTENFLKHFIENSKEYTILELVELQQKYLNINNHLKLKKTRIIN